MSLSISYTFSPTTTVASGQVNQNFADIVSYINTVACVANMMTMWKGSVASIPSGWVLDTDARDKFILGGGNLYTPGNSGGATTVNSSHTHPFSGTTDSSPDTQYANLGDENQPVSGPAGRTFSGNTSAGGSTTLSIMPPYYVACIIRKT